MKFRSDKELRGRPLETIATRLNKDMNECNEKTPSNKNSEEKGRF